MSDKKKDLEKIIREQIPYPEKKPDGNRVIIPNRRRPLTESPSHEEDEDFSKPTNRLGNRDE